MGGEWKRGGIPLRSVIVKPEAVPPDDGRIEAIQGLVEVLVLHDIAKTGDVLLALLKPLKTVAPVWSDLLVLFLQAVNTTLKNVCGRTFHNGGYPWINGRDTTQPQVRGCPEIAGRCPGGGQERGHGGGGGQDDSGPPGGLAL